MRFHSGSTSGSEIFKISPTGLVWSNGGFSKQGSSDLYVLLGAGGHKLISDFTPSLITSTAANGVNNVATGNTNTYLNIVQGGVSLGSSSQITGTGTVS